MSGIIVVTGVNQLPASERWRRFVAPLAEALAHSGLGSLPDLEDLKREHNETGCVQAAELAINLINFDYGRPLVDRVVDESGINREDQAMPARWRDFHCADYFDSNLAKQGYCDEYWYVLPADRVYEDIERQFLVIGGPGFDGIDWGYRRGHTGLWAWYPVNAEFAPLAPTVQRLVHGWLSGAITL